MDKNNEAVNEITEEEPSRKRKYTKRKDSKSESNQYLPKVYSEPRRKCGVTETPNMDVVIGYNIYPEGVKDGIPRITVNAEPLPSPDIVNGLPGFEGVNDSKRVIFRRVPGNNFFFELIKTNMTNERIFLVCEPKEGNKILNLSGRNFNILFVGRNGEEVLSIRPYPNTKETVSVIYRQQEVGRIIRQGTSDNSEVSHTILDSDLNKSFILRKSFQVIHTTTCCFNNGNRKIGNGYNIFAVKKDGASKNNEDYRCVGFMTETELKFNYGDSLAEAIGVFDKILLFATLVSIRTKAMESAGPGFRISLSFPLISN